MSDEDPGPSQKRYRFGDDRPPKTMKLTEDEIAKIREMSTAGITARAIGEKLGRTQESVLAYLQKLRESGVEGLKPPKIPRLSPETIQKIKDLKAQCMKQKDIAAQVGCSDATVVRVLKDISKIPKPTVAQRPREKFTSPFATAYSEARGRYSCLLRDRKATDSRPVTISKEDYVAIYVQGSCLTCGRDDKSLAYGVDRLFPDLGYVPGNCANMCWMWCNKSKGARDIVSFVRQSQDIAHFADTGEMGPNEDAWPKFSMGSSYYESYHGAKTRGLSYELTEAEYHDICFRACALCGHPPVPMHGVDRIDSSKGYTLDNCATACSVCNMAKKDLSVDEYNELSRKTASRAVKILDFVEDLRKEHEVETGATMMHSYPFQCAPGQKCKELLDVYATTGVSATQEELARIVGVKNRASISGYVSKIKVCVDRNPGWFVHEYGSIPKLPEPGPTQLSDDEKTMVIAMAKEGRTDRYIAKELKRDVTTIGNCVNEYREAGGTGVRDPWAPRVTTEERREMWNLHESGMKQRDIAHKFGKSEGCISTLLKKMREKSEQPCNQ